jgi:hypothetical protein
LDLKCQLFGIVTEAQHGTAIGDITQRHATHLGANAYNLRFTSLYVAQERCTQLRRQQDAD